MHKIIFIVAALNQDQICIVYNVSLFSEIYTWDYFELRVAGLIIFFKRNLFKKFREM